MLIKKLHPWNMAPKEAIQLQNQLRNKIIIRDEIGPINIIAGADIALTKSDHVGFAAVIVYSYPDLKEIERVSAQGRLTFPYIPGLLSFREAPLLLKAFSMLTTRPDIVMFDGQGIAHPRRIGIASHMGLWLNIPTIGCAKSRLIGEYQEPDIWKGAYSNLYDNDEIIGVVMRTRDNVRPIFVSPGHLISLKSAYEITMKCVDGLRIPKPTRIADKLVKQLKKSLQNARKEQLLCIYS